MKNQCPHCGKRIRGMIFPNQKWLGMDIYPRKDRGRCPHCDGAIVYNPRYLRLWAMGWLSFLAAVLVPELIGTTGTASKALKTVFLLLFLVSISVSVFGVATYARKEANG